MPFSDIAAQMVQIGSDFYRRNWVLGTSGNFSAVLGEMPLRIAITSSGLDKGALTTDRILEIDGEGNVLRGQGQPSAETLLHLRIIGLRRAGAVLHTHSVWSTILSEAFAPDYGISIQDFEMLKGLEGVTTHEHREWLPIIENSQDMTALSRVIEDALTASPGAHGLLLRRHGLYAWGRDLGEARRHVEILEFLLEVLGRTHGAEAGVG